MKPRRVIITIEAETDLPLATLRNIDSIELVGIDGFPDYLFAHDGDGSRIVQVQANAIKPERKAKGMVSVSVRPSSKEPVYTGFKFSERLEQIHDIGDVVKRGKAKRAKGAK